MDQFAVEKYDNKFFSSLIESLVKTGCKINRTANSMMRKRISELDTVINRLWEDQPDNGPDRQQCYEIRNELINKRELQIHRLEEAHVNKTFDNYHKQADRTTSYHLRKNAYKKVPTEIECLRDRNGKLTVDRTVIEEKVHEFYKQRFTTKRSKLGPMNTDLLDSDATPKINGELHKQQPEKIQLFELEQAISKVNAGSAPGPDGCTGGLFKEIFQTLPLAFTELMNDFYTNGTKDYNIRNLKIIEKPGKPSYLLLGSWRPIALINVAVKLYETVMYNRIVFLLSQTDLRFSDFLQTTQHIKLTRALMTAIASSATSLNKWLMPESSWLPWNLT